MRLGDEVKVNAGDGMETAFVIHKYDSHNVCTVEFASDGEWHTLPQDRVEPTGRNRVDDANAPFMERIAGEQG